MVACLLNSQWSPAACGLTLPCSLGSFWPSSSSIRNSRLPPAGVMLLCSLASFAAFCATGARLIRPTGGGQKSPRRSVKGVQRANGPLAGAGRARRNPRLARYAAPLNSQWSPAAFGVTLPCSLGSFWPSSATGGGQKSPPRAIPQIADPKKPCRRITIRQGTPIWRARSAQADLSA